MFQVWLSSFFFLFGGTLSHLEPEPIGALWVEKRLTGSETVGPRRDPGGGMGTLPSLCKAVQFTRFLPLPIKI